MTCACTGARRPSIATIPTSTRDTDYVDLEPGWRLRIVTPILKSGGYVVHGARQENANPSALTIQTTDDFLGYETAYYLIRAGRDHRLRFHLTSATVTKSGISTPTQAPLNSRISFPENFKLARMLYRVRLNSSDHQSALLAANTISELNALTSQMLSGQPFDQRHNSQSAALILIPFGISILPEAQRLVDGRLQWTAAPAE